MGPPGSWGQGRGWSLARSEVEPAPFSWGSQIVAMQGRGEVGVGGVSVHLPGKAQTGSPRPWNSSHQRPAPPPPPQPHPLPGAIVHGLCYISGLGPSTQPFLWKTWVSQFALLKIILPLIQRIAPMYTSLPIDRASQALKYGGFSTLDISSR